MPGNVKSTFDAKPRNFAVEETTPQVTIKEVKIESLLDAHVVYFGQVSGRQYEWPRAGSVVSVDERDAPELLGKRRGRTPCCGASPDGNKIFHIIGG